MIEQYLYIVIQYKEAATIADSTNPGEMVEGEQQVIVGKSVADEKEYTHQLPITPDLPGEQQLNQWQTDGALVVISASSVRAMSFQHQEKDEEGNPKKYPTPGKVYKAGNKTLEIGTMVTFQSYGIRLADADDEARAKEAHGRFLKRQQESRMRSIADRQTKAKERTAKRL